MRNVLDIYEKQTGNSFDTYVIR